MKSSVLPLLEQVKLFNTKKREYISSTGESFNMFRICGVNHYENTHSSIIAEILNPKGSHQFGTKFLDAFLSTLYRANVIPPEFVFNTYGAIIETERVIKEGRLDILITNNDGQALLLENKIYADDGINQLKRYEEFAINNYKDNYKLLYLTLFGNESFEASAQKVNYIQVSYSEIILSWLDRCIEICASMPIVRETIIQYSNHIKSLTNQTTSIIMDKELVELLCEKDNLEAAFAISNYMDTVRNNIINTELIPQLKELAKELEIDFKSGEGEYVNTSWAGFWFQVSQFENFDLFMEFGSRGLRNLIIGYIPKSESSNLHALSALKNITNSANNRCAYQKFKYHNWDVEAMLAIKDGTMAKQIKRHLEFLLEKGKEVEHI